MKFSSAFFLLTSVVSLVSAAPSTKIPGPEVIKQNINTVTTRLNAFNKAIGDFDCKKSEFKVFPSVIHSCASVSDPYEQEVINRGQALGAILDKTASDLNKANPLSFADARYTLDVIEAFAPTVVHAMKTITDKKSQFQKIKGATDQIHTLVTNIGNSANNVHSGFRLVNPVCPNPCWAWKMQF
ncbi:hypothetical protein FPV67DRAFT_1118635 [Lyophyllum atratum]|nr:hypothetical protein FPV67DRAFT_1118635 [Lyophyllum atratum]